jgi:hypothetical protein
MAPSDTAFAIDQAAAALLRSMAGECDDGFTAAMNAALDERGGVVVSNGQTFVRRGALQATWDAVLERAVEKLRARVLAAAPATPEVVDTVDEVFADMVRFGAELMQRDFPVLH